MFVLYTVCTLIVIAVILICFYQNRIYMIPKWKVWVSAVTMVIAGTFGVYLLAYIEQGNWGNKSFFGCIFAGVPVLFLLSRIIQVPSEVLMDMAGPVCAIFLGLIKINCWHQYCCYGFILYSKADGTRVRFPSQFLESISGFIICAVLLHMQKKPHYRGLIAPYFLVIYGSTRFILNFFRDNLETIRFFKDCNIFLPQGHLWGLVCIIWGLLWMQRIQNQKVVMNK